MKLLKEAEYMAATGFTLTPANGFALGGWVHSALGKAADD